MAYITENLAYVVSKLKYNFVAQPFKVTVNNIIKELPSIFPPTEACISSFNKAYVISGLKYIFGPMTGIDFSDIEHDNTHKGAFVQNFVSGLKNFWLWSGNVPRGTKTHGLDRVASDIFLKGECKMLAKSWEFLNHRPLLANSLCEGAGFIFLDAKENIENANQSFSNSTAWKDQLSEGDLYLEATRKAIVVSGISKVVTERIIKPFITVEMNKINGEFIPNQSNIFIKIHALSNYVLGATTTAALVYGLGLKITVKDIPVLGDMVEASPSLNSVDKFALWPGFTPLAKLILAGVIIVPFIRIGIYSINPALEVFTEQDNKLEIKPIGDVLDEAKEKGIVIEYKYDAHKGKERNTSYEWVIESKKHFMYLSKDVLLKDSNNKIIVHYPVEEDWVAGISKHASSVLGDELLEAFIQFGEASVNLADAIENTVYSASVRFEDSIVSFAGDVYSNLVSLIKSGTEAEL